MEDVRDSSIASVWHLASYGSSKALGSVHLSEWMHVHITYVNSCVSEPLFITACMCEIVM